MSAKRTDWYPSGVKPVRVGPYDCKTCRVVHGRGRHYWDGEQWKLSKTGNRMIDQYFRWRGLAEKPK